MTHANKQRFIGLCTALASVFVPSSVHGQIFVTNWNSGTVGEYTTAGAPLNPALISGLSYPQAIVLSGGNLFITDFNGFSGTVGEYTTAGTPVNPALVAGIGADPSGLAVSGGDLFVDNWFNRTIGEYDAATGTVVNAALISGGPPGMITLSGGNLYEVNVAAKSVGEYTTAGATVNANLVNYATGSPNGVAVDGGRLYLADGYSGTISVYDAGTGAVINPALVSGLDSPYGIVVFGGYLFVANFGNGTIGEYDAATGAVVNAALISGLSGPFGLAVESLATTFAAAPTALTYTGAAQGPVITSSPSDATYSVTAGTASATAAGAYSVTLTANGNYSGGQTLGWSIAPASPVLTYPAPAAINSGTAITAAQLDATANVPGAFTYTLDGSGITAGEGVVPAAGTHALVASFVPDDATDYTEATISATLTVNGVAGRATFSIAPRKFVYDGLAQGPVITANPSTAIFALTGTYSATMAGRYSFTVTATGGYKGSRTFEWVMVKAEPKLTYPAPAPISYGAAITAAQLDASANVPGSFAYKLGGRSITPAAGVIPEAGIHRLAALFTPADTADYCQDRITTTLEVKPAAATFRLSPGSFTYDGSTHRPTITASPSAATFCVTGTESAKKIGTYSLTVTARGNYAGSQTFTWSIVPAHGP